MKEAVIKRIAPGADLAGANLAEANLTGAIVSVGNVTRRLA